MVNVTMSQNAAQEFKNFYHLYHVPHLQNFQFILTVLLEIRRTVEDQMLCLFLREEPLNASCYYTK